VKGINFLRVFCAFFFLFFLCPAGFSQDNTEAYGGALSCVAVLRGGSVAASVNTGDTGRIFILSALNCESRNFTTDAPISKIAADENDIGALWGIEAGFLKKWNILDGQEVVSLEVTPGERLNGFFQAEDTLLVWSDKTLALLSADNPAVIWKIAARNISGVSADPKNDTIYTTDFDGNLEKLNYQGRVLNIFSLDKPIYAVSKGQPADPASDTLFLAMGDELLRYDSSKDIFTRISTLSSENVQVSKDGYLHIEGGGRYSVFAYPGMKLIHSENAKGRLLLLPNGNSLIFSGDTVNFFDFNRKKGVGKIVILNDAVGFLSPNLDYYGNAQFRQAAANGMITGVAPYLLKEKEPNAKLACDGFPGLLTDISKPEVPSVHTTVKPQTPQAPPTPQEPQAPQTTATLTVSPESPALTAVASEIAVALPIPRPAEETAPIIPTLPAIETIPTPVLAPGSDIPDWVMRPSSLPEFSAVKSGKQQAQALKESRLKIRDDVARAVMKNMLEIEIVKNLPSEDVKKRFLWMVGGRTAQLASEYAVQTDLWTSRENVYYLWAHIDTEIVNQIYDPIFQEEMNLFNTYGAEGYLNRTPFKWD
jgi:hypothetical protein